MRGLTSVTVVALAACFVASDIPAQTLNLDYSTYLGGDSPDRLTDAVVSSAGEAYISGYAGSVNFPTISSYQNSCSGVTDAVLVKFSSAGSLLYSSYLGGTSWEYAYGVAIDTANRPYIVGKTFSDDFPTRLPYQSTNAFEYDAFISKFSSSGTALLYSTYLGGNQWEEANALCVDSTGRSYIIGDTSSSNFPTVAAYQSTYNGSWDVVVSILSSSGSALSYSTYLGGSGSDVGQSLSLDSTGRICLTGGTYSNDFPIRYQYQSTNAGNEDVFVSLFASTGSTLLYSTYCGGGGLESGVDVSIDSIGRAVVGGWTESTDWPTASAYQSSSAGWRDAVVFMLSSTGEELPYSTYLGGSDNDQVNGLALGSDGSIHIAGQTSSSDFPVRRQYQSVNAGAIDGFLTRFLSSGSSLLYSTYLGGADDDEATGLGIDAAGRAYLAGATDSVNFPTVNPYQASNATSQDGFLSILSYALTPTPPVARTPTPPPTATPLRTPTPAPETPTPLRTPTPVGPRTPTPVPTPWQAGCLEGWDQTTFLLEFFETWPPAGWMIQTEGMGVCPWQSGAVAGNPNNTGGTGNFADANRDYCAGSIQTLLVSPELDLSLAENPWVEFKSDIYSTAGACCTVNAVIDGTTWMEVTNICTSQRGARTYSFPLHGAGWESNVKVVFRYMAFSDDMWWQVDDVKVFGCTLGMVTPSPTPTPAPEGHFLPIDSGDYNGDGTSDIAVFRGSAGMWSIRNLTRAYFGLSTDDPVPADYDGNGTTDIAVFRPNEEMWSVRNVTRFYLGGPTDQPVPGDYNGDGAAEGGIFREGSGLWSIRNVTRVYFGASGDFVAPGFYNADGTKDIAIFRETGGLWSVRNVSRFYFGTGGDDLVPGDYNGAGRWEGGIFRPATGMWSVRNVTRMYLGVSGDWAVPGDYDGNGRDGAAIFRESSGMWSVRNLTRVYFGAANDMPVTR